MTDPYLDPSTGLLRNTLGLVDSAALEQAEREITHFALARLSEQSLPGGYDLLHLQTFHRMIFQDLYPWAGELRTVAISKGDMFCLPQHLESFSAEVFGALAKENRLRGLDRETFVSRLAFHFGEVNAIHPFREGNGRAQRAFFGQLARDAGYPLAWRRLDAARNISASIAIMRGDPEPMRLLLAGLIE
jgi:cell filamentation protein